MYDTIMYFLWHVATVLLEEGPLRVARTLAYRSFILMVCQEGASGAK